MEEMLMRLSSAHRLNPFNTSCSAAERFVGSVFVRMLSQLSRIRVARSRRSSPCAIDFLREMVRLLCSDHTRVSGVTTSRSPRNKAIAAIATIPRSCWRLLTFTSPPFHPAVIETELQRALSSNLVHLYISNFFGVAQLIKHFEQRLVIARHPRTRNLGLISNFERFRGHHPVDRKSFRELPHDR